MYLIHPFEVLVVGKCPWKNETVSKNFPYEKYFTLFEVIPQWVIDWNEVFLVLRID